MRLPRYLEFLRPRLSLLQLKREGLSFRGDLKVERQHRGGPKVLCHESKNFIVDAGITGIRDLLGGVNSPSGFAGSIFRMAVGDGGVPAGDLFNPKLPDATWPARTALFHEVFRSDITVWSEPTSFSIQFVGAFDSLDVDLTSFLLSELVINEAALIIGDGVTVVGGDPKQVNKTPPDTVDVDELMMSTRTFNSVSFDPADDITVTITWTITVSS